MLIVKDLNQYYSGSHILRNVSFEVPKGQLTSLLGRNGVGKTTLLKSLMGVVKVKTGSIAWEGKELANLPPWSRVDNGFAYVPQGREIFPRLTVEENLLIGAAKFSSSKSIPSYIYELFPILSDMKARRGGDLSGGQQQQLAIGRALMSQPELIILDEPTEGIQPSIIQDIGRCLRKLVDEMGITVLLVEQYYDFAKELSDNYIVMRRGEVVAQGKGVDMDINGVQEMISV
ncbi:urea ABC transporter ATP-binding subunit UrtE [Polynucleobacter asymbioticus]|jgi:urea transport system ATP-binding protein|uniref:ABC transporter ATP-binding protein n=1 Tax=Polynucleobacter asymbioticus TaxID=576611 RepID=A0AAC9IY77_9BURK|nr:urea ABC transporter ATP-binding subunit UrtE [Polynucleobacter asymbioticus]APB99097.1 ABC transporter ATP-binding protein [Polynucleobacter asymbioticus]APC01397.1 ABC transporter ATP-binding protein [Polynucleobacter asymbioticus]